ERRRLHRRSPAAASSNRGGLRHPRGQDRVRCLRTACRHRQGCDRGDERGRGARRIGGWEAAMRLKPQMGPSRLAHETFAFRVRAQRGHIEETRIPRRSLLFAWPAGVVAASLSIFAAHAQAPALTGQVPSAAEGPMEGVVVSAKRDGSTLPTPVVSDNTGKFSSPASKLEPGRYSLAIRAIGYDLDGPKTADVAAGRTPAADVKLRP